MLGKRCIFAKHIDCFRIRKMNSALYVQVFLELLRAGMWERKPHVPQEFVEWGRVLRLAKSQSVLGIVGNVVLKDEALAARVPQELKEQIKPFLMRNVLMHRLLNATLTKVVTALREGGVESVLLKGQGVARNYPQPELRQCGDIDLYVGLENAEKAHDLLAPMAVKIDAKERIPIDKHYHVTMPGGVEIEIHRYTQKHCVRRIDALYQEASDKATSENLVVCDFDGVLVNTPAADFNAYFIFDHLFHHFLTSGVGLRQFCDWMMFLHEHRGKLDAGYLRQMLVSMEQLEAWQAFGCVLVDRLGLPEEEFPLFDRKQEGKVEKILRVVLKEGNFGKERSVYKNRSTNYWIYKMQSLIGYMEKALDLVTIFPKPVWNQYRSTIIGGFARVWADITIRK